MKITKKLWIGGSSVALESCGNEVIELHLTSLLSKVVDAYVGERNVIRLATTTKIIQTQGM